MKHSIKLAGFVTLATAVLGSGCIPPGPRSGVEGTFHAHFQSVDPSSILAPPPGSLAPVPKDIVINGHGWVALAAIDPTPVPTATPLTGGVSAGSGSSSSGSGTSSGGSTLGNPPQMPPIVYQDILSLTYESSLFDDDCSNKARQAAAQGLQLDIEGEGTVTYAGVGLEQMCPVSNMAGGSTTGCGGLVGGATVHATKIISCSISTVNVCNMLPPTTDGGTSAIKCCPAGALCVPPPQPLPPAPAPTPL